MKISKNSKILIIKHPSKHKKKEEQVKKITGIVVLAVLLVSIFSGCTEMSGDQIVQKMKEKQESIKDFSATMVMSSSFTGKSDMAKAKIISKMPQKSRVEFLEPSELAGQITVTDGTTLWNYDPKRNEVTKMDLPETEGPSQMDYTFIKELINQTDISYQGAEKFEGRSVYVIRASPKDAGMMMSVRYSMLIDSETWMPLKIDMFDKDNNQIMSFEYKEIKFNTGIPDSEFEFKVPEGVTVITRDMPPMPEEMTLEEAKKKVNFTVLSPSYLPAGYAFKTATVMKYDSVETVNLIYLEGTRTIYIMEKPRENIPDIDMPDIEKVSINGAEGKLLSLPIGGKMLTWSTEKLDIVMSSELSKEEMIKVAGSMK